MNELSNAFLFNKHSYIYHPNILTSEVSSEYINNFRKIIEDGGTNQEDSQAPLSQSLSQHHPLFDDLLEKLCPIISDITGKKLLPTYAYARWYKPGDELLVHQDREACEYSATITLGFSGSQWPFYVGTNKDKSDKIKVNMNIGDAVIYKGCDLWHWREKYTEGEWQAQVFIHYVDAEGPYKEWKYDKRSYLSHHLEKVFEGVFSVAPNAFSSESCTKIISEFEKQNLQEATLGSGKEESVDKKIRDTKKVVQNNDTGLGATLTGIGIQANSYKWNFNITKSNQSEFLQYGKEGHFASHVDTFLEEFNNKETRKISVILILNDDYEGGKFYLQVGNEKVYPRQEKGDVIIFPSFFLHGVEPVTSGIRRSVITWLVGPYFK